MRHCRPVLSTSSPAFHPSAAPLSNALSSLYSQSLTTAKFCNSFLLITMRIAGGGRTGSPVPTPDFCSLRSALRLLISPSATKCSKLSPPSGFLCFQSPTHCPIYKPFVLMTLQQYP